MVLGFILVDFIGLRLLLFLLCGILVWKPLHRFKFRCEEASRWFLRDHEHTMAVIHGLAEFFLAPVSLFGGGKEHVCHIIDLSLFCRYLGLISLEIESLEILKQLLVIHGFWDRTDQ